MAYNIHKAYTGSASWQKVEPRDSARRGWILQNQSANGGNILIAGKEPSSDFSAIELIPNGSLVEDVLGSNDELWIKSVSGATLTVVLKY